MLSSSYSYQLTLQSTKMFQPGFDTIAESDEYDSDSDDSYY